MEIDYVPGEENHNWVRVTLDQNDLNVDAMDLDSQHRVFQALKGKRILQLFYERPPPGIGLMTLPIYNWISQFMHPNHTAHRTYED